MRKAVFPFLIALLLAGCRPPDAPPPPPSAEPFGPAVILVSWDGAKPGALRSLLDRGRLPVFRSLLEEGCWTWKARTILPSSTLPAHVSMLTGCAPETHGVTWNTYRPDRGPVDSGTVFEAVAAAGRSACMVYGKEKLRHLEKPGTLAASVHEDGTPEDVARRALEILEIHSPGFLFIHFRHPDAAGHESGWGCEAEGVPPSKKYLESLEDCDRSLGTLCRRLAESGRWPRTLLILTADHGGHRDNHGSDHPEDVTIPWVASGGPATRRGEIREAVSILDTVPTALGILGITVPPACEGRAVDLEEGVLAPAA